MAELSSYVEGIRTRGIAVTEISDPDIGDVIVESLSEYSRYRPILAGRTFTTVKGKQAYSWADMGDVNGLGVEMVTWNPSACVGEWSLGSYLTELGLPVLGTDYHLPSMEIVEQIKACAHQNAYRGSGYQLDTVGGDLYLTPTPIQDGQTVFIVYTKALTDVKQVKNADRDIFLDLVESRLSYRMVNEIAAKSQAVRIKTPEYEIATGEQIGAWRKHGQEMRNQFVSKANAGDAAAGRT